MTSTPPGPDDSFAELIGHEIVIDTHGAVVYLGTLESVRTDGLWLRDADVHDRSDGHATKELYICEARRHGVRPNRRAVFVCRATIISASRLADVVAD